MTVTYPKLRDELRFWASLVTYPFIVAFWFFVDYIWPWLWKSIVGILIGTALGLIIRVVYLGDDPSTWSWWFWPW